MVHFHDSVIAEGRRDLHADLFAESWATVVAAMRTIIEGFGAEPVARPPLRRGQRPAALPPPDRPRPRWKAVVSETVGHPSPSRRRSAAILCSSLLSPVSPSHPHGLTFGDLRWDRSVLGLAANQSAVGAVLNFARFLDPVLLGAEPVRLSAVWMLPAKESIAALARPFH